MLLSGAAAAQDDDTAPPAESADQNAEREQSASEQGVVIDIDPVVSLIGGHYHFDDAAAVTWRIRPTSLMFSLSFLL